MVCTAILASALNTGAAHPYSLTINGLDVIPPAGVSTGVIAPLESVVVTHAAPGDVSALEFDVHNTGNTFTVAAGDVVVLWDNTRSRPVFRGFVQTPTTVRLGVGRSVHVTCAGIEIALDWLKLGSDMVVTAPAIVSDQIQRAYALCIGLGIALNTGQPPGHTGLDRGSRDTPVGDVLNSFVLTTMTITAGTTLRSAISQLWQAGLESLGSQGGPTYSATVDMWGGLRVWAWNTISGVQVPSDFATLTVTDTYASALAAGDLAHTVDGGAIVRGVLVIGGNAAGSGVVMDGTGRPGKVVTISDATSLTAAKRDGIAASAIAAGAEQPAGRFNLVDWTPQADVWPGSPLALTDAQVGAAATYRLSQINRSFTGARETWDVAYGVPAPSYINTV